MENSLVVLHLKPSSSDSADRGCSIIRVGSGVENHSKEVCHWKQELSLKKIMYDEAQILYFTEIT